MKVIGLIAIIAAILAVISVGIITMTCSCDETPLEECPEGQEIQFKTEKPFLCGECSVSECARATS